MDCPKCQAVMEEHTLSTLSGGITVDRCTQCKGLWFDIGEADPTVGLGADAGDFGIGHTVAVNHNGYTSFLSPAGKRENHMFGRGGCDCGVVLLEGFLEK